MAAASTPDEPEVGILPVELTEAGRADSVFAGLPKELLTLQWHGDTFDLPDGAILLAGSSAYPNQAFRFGSAAYGVQFHLEVSPELAREWAEVPAYAEALERMLGPGAVDRLIDSLDAEADAMLGHGRLSSSAGSRSRRRWPRPAESAVPPARRRNFYDDSAGRDDRR